MKQITKAIILFISLLVSTSTFAQNSKVLFVMSEADTLLLKKGKKKRSTGVFLNEFYQAYKAIINEGYTVDFATPSGGKASIDQESLNDDYWKENLEMKQEAIDFWESNTAFSNPMILEEAIERESEYIGLVIPGGQGLMVDLIYDQNTPELLKSFAKDQKAIGLICHAPSLITTIPKNDNPFIGYNVNSVTGFEEFYIEKFIMKGKPKNRKIAKQLKKLGLKYEKGRPGKSFAIRDRNLVTSQNPYSGNKFNTLYLKALEEVK
ncbi:DJ-1/PfpI family protein [Flammeovirga sp. SJP92]|uniref:DJ-1/PfpI family protein n=1 Tax=Flammeovirga sp. SJP92 TaxID=1775430 RepID=UPI0012FA3079|nr:DJ-1/PfpI family protein [Flammeovirga sp. SJP92]